MRTQVMEQPAYKSYITQVMGSAPRGFIAMKVLEQLALGLQRPLTHDEVTLFVDIERNPSGDPLKCKCAACGAGFTPFQWRMPSVDFSTAVARGNFAPDGKSLKALIEKFDLRWSGCFWVPADNVFEEPITVCGSPVTEFNESKQQFRSSCYRTLQDQLSTTGPRIWGQPLFVINAIRQEIEEERSAAEAARKMKEQQQREQQAQQAELQRRQDTERQAARQQKFAGLAAKLRPATQVA